MKTAWKWQAFRGGEVWPSSPWGRGGERERVHGQLSLRGMALMHYNFPFEV